MSESVILDDVRKKPFGLKVRRFFTSCFFRKTRNDVYIRLVRTLDQTTTQKLLLKLSLILFMCKIQWLDHCRKSSPAFIAIIEECFPYEAMSDPEVFYDAENNPEQCWQKMSDHDELVVRNL